MICYLSDIMSVQLELSICLKLCRNGVATAYRFPKSIFIDRQPATIQIVSDNGEPYTSKSYSIFKIFYQHYFCLSDRNNG